MQVVGFLMQRLKIIILLFPGIVCRLRVYVNVKQPFVFDTQIIWFKYQNKNNTRAVWEIRGNVRLFY